MVKELSWRAFFGGLFGYGYLVPDIATELAEYYMARAEEDMEKLKDFESKHS